MNLELIIVLFCFMALVLWLFSALKASGLDSSYKTLLPLTFQMFNETVNRILGKKLFSLKATSRVLVLSIGLNSIFLALYSWDHINRLRQQLQPNYQVYLEADGAIHYFLLGVVVREFENFRISPIYFGVPLLALFVHDALSIALTRLVARSPWSIHIKLGLELTLLCAVLLSTVALYSGFYFYSLYNLFAGSSSYTTLEYYRGPSFVDSYRFGLLVLENRIFGFSSEYAPNSEYFKYFVLKGSELPPYALSVSASTVYPSGLLLLSLTLASLLQAMGRLSETTLLWISKCATSTFSFLIAGIGLLITFLVALGDYLAT